MNNIIKDSRTYRIEFGEGKYNSWCVFLTKLGSVQYAPSEIECFEFFEMLSAVFDPQRIYEDFVQIYSMTDKAIDDNVLKTIHDICQNYNDYSLEYEIWLTILYAGLIADSNNKYNQINKRIKRLKMHQILLEAMSSEQIAHFYKGASGIELDELMRNRGL